MRKHYLHLSVYRCDNCDGPVVSGSVGVRENEISRETDKREIGTACLSCGHPQTIANTADFTRRFPPVEWNPAGKPYLATDEVAAVAETVARR